MANHWSCSKQREAKLKLCFHPQIDVGRPIEEVFELVKAVFTPKDEKVKCRCCALQGVFSKQTLFWKE